MYREMSIAVVIPALNEEQSIGQVIDAIPSFVDDIVVADNGSTDNTPQVVTQHGARVVTEPRRGYGQACLTALKAIAQRGGADVTVFLDGDFADDPTQMPSLLDKIVDEDAQLVIGSRLLGHCERGALTLPQVFGNKLACWLIGHFWNIRMTDLGPFRAVTRTALDQLKMDDPDFGWTVQMQTRAAARGLRYAEVPVDYKRRIGTSKISGTLRGVYLAGTKILYTIFIEAHEQLSQENRMRPTEALNIFSRYPQPGQTKTRLIPVLGPQGAADLQTTMTTHTLSTARAFNKIRPHSDSHVYYAGGDATKMAQQFSNHFPYHPQADGHLGQRMAQAFIDRFNAGAQRVVTVGIDCPDITTDTLHHAFDTLKTHDLVLGPASDGGYYLIGLSRMASPLFTNLDWGTSTVLQQTLAIAKQNNLTVKLLDVLDDVDEPEDIPIWSDFQKRLTEPSPQATISVIIPTLNESKRLNQTLAHVTNLPNVEVIVVDGHSVDDTTQIAHQRGVGVIQCTPGRAAQMNAGTAEASGDILLFLHADTLLPTNWAHHLRTALPHNDHPSNHAPFAGAFQLGINAPGPTMRFIERCVNLRSRLLALPYGDQAIFISRNTFDRLNGYAPLPIMEDYDLIQRAKKLTPLTHIPHPVQTSARFWRKRGQWRTTLINQAIILGYHLGINPKKLAAWRNNTK